MDKYYSFLGLLTLPAGSWANWFSGAASAAAVIVALGGHYLAERRAAKERRERDLQSALQIGWKILNLLNATHDIYRHFWVAPDPTLRGILGRVERWRSTYPLVGVELESGLALNEAETGFLLRNRKADLLMNLRLAFGRYQSIVLSAQEYKTRHSALHDLMPPAQGVEGNLAAHHLTQEQAMRLAPYCLQLESIIEGIRSLTLENVQVLRDQLAAYSAAMTEIYGKPLLEFDQDTKVGDFDTLGQEIPR